MAWELSTAARNAALAGVTGLIDAGTGPGVIEIRTDTKPGVGNAATGTLLATITLVDPSFAAPSTGAAALADPGPVTAVGTGTAGHARVKDSTGAVVMDGVVTATGGGGDITLASTAVSAGQTVDVTGGSLLMPAGG